MMLWARRWLPTLLMGLPSIGQAQADDLSLRHEAWSIRFSQGMPPRPALADVGWSFDFPRGSECETKHNCPSVHYVTTPYRKPIPADATLVIAFRIVTQGQVKFNHRLEAANTCSSHATVRAFLQRADDDLYAANGRFWSNPVATILAPGSFIMAIKLRPDQWTNVDGERDRKGFETLLGNVGDIGITFGGGCFFGHGVNVQGGSAKFVMSGFAIR